MMHNSLFRRELLRTMNRHPLVLRRRDVHRNVGLRSGAVSGPGQIKLQDAWSIHCARDLPAERAVAEDARDFLERVGVKIETGAPKQILLEIGSADRGFRCVVSADRVEVHGQDAAALWAGWVHLENQMRAAGGAIVTAGEKHAEPAWSAQIAPPTWGANYAVPDFSEEYLGDDTFRELAHHGADGMFIYGDLLLYATGTRLNELDHPDAIRHLDILRKATQRAGKFGVKLYFCAVGPKLPEDHALFKRLPGVRGARLQEEAGGSSRPLHCLCSSHADALAFHGEVVNRLFREVPELGGMILIIGGESYYHCFMRAADSPIGHTNCPQCAGKVAEDVIANLLKVTADAATSAQPTARLMAWPYSAQYFWSQEPNQLRLIDRLPGNVALLSEVDKDQFVQRGPCRKHIWDYSVDYDGHSDRIVAQATRCAQRGRDLFIKTETSHGIELLHLPYVPAIGRSARQWQSVRVLRPKGVLQRWGFVGMFDSVAERIGYLARWDENFAPESATMQVAREVVGDLAPVLVKAWAHFDESVHHIPVLTTGGYYRGPAFLGPAHPLPVWEGPTPQAFKGNLFYLQEGQATFSNERADAKDDLTVTTAAQIGGTTEAALAAIEGEFGLARDAAQAGHDILQGIKADSASKAVREELDEQRFLGEYLYRTYRATVNTLRFIRLRQWPAKQGDNGEALVAIARDELENAKAARRIYEQAPWLNHLMRLDVGTPDSLKMIDQKVQLLEAFMSRAKE